MDYQSPSFPMEQHQSNSRHPSRPHEGNGSSNTDVRPTSTSTENKDIKNSPANDNADVSNLDEANTATVIVLGATQPVLEGPMEMPNANAALNDNLIRYFPNANNSDSAFVSVRDANNNLINSTTGGNARSPPLSNIPLNFGIGGAGGGGGGDVQPDNVPDTFRLDQIGGLDEQKNYLQRSIILPLVRPDVLKAWGVSPPKGILLHGPPGTGKTFMAKALVNELKEHLGEVKFFYRKGADVLSMWFGESQKKLREVFDAAKAHSPSVIFFDEIDGLCPSRDGNHGTEAYASVVTCFLGQMDGLENGKVFVVAATNRLEAVDPAVRRPGRFDKHLAFGFPDEIARQKIVQIHTSKWNNNDQPSRSDLENIAKSIIGFSGADIEKLCKDVVYVAIEANNGVFDESLRVTYDHWTLAVNGMQRTATNSFGSSLFMPTKPNQIISELIQPVVTKVINMVNPMLSSPSIALSMTQLPTLQKSFLIYIEPNQSKSFLNNHILNGILSDPLFNKMALFEISTTTVVNKVLTGAKPTILSVIIDVVNQAYDAQQSENCAVVVIPNINELLEVKTNHGTPALILKALAKIKGPKMFLFATSSVPLDNIREYRINELFSGRYMPAVNPRHPQLNQFFQFVLAPKKTTFPEKGELLDEVADAAARSSDNNNHEDILNLASALSQVPISEKENNDLVKHKFDTLLENYQSSKLL